jgi:hypothetical protein
MLHGNKSFKNVVANATRVQDFARPLVKIQGCKNKSFTTKTTNNLKLATTTQHHGNISRHK